MAVTPSKMLPLGTEAPDFLLLDVSGKNLGLQTLKSDKATVIAFICNHCPFVKHIIDAFVNVAAEYQKQGISFITINSNDVVNYPDDSPENMVKFANAHHFTFPYLFDETQTIAESYEAACTPDLYVFDRDLKCVYRGQFDGARPGNNVPITGDDLKNALNAVLENKPVSQNQKASMGCNIKWK